MKGTTPSVFAVSYNNSIVLVVYGVLTQLHVQSTLPYELLMSSSLLSLHTYGRIMLKQAGPDSSLVDLTHPRGSSNTMSRGRQ